MPDLKTYDLFISHAWDYNSEYYNLERMLKDAPYFYFRNYSVPQHDSLQVNTDYALDDGLWKQIRPVNTVLILSGMYYNHRKWIQREIEIAQALNKPIIGVIPWGQERIPSEVSGVAKTMVHWNTSSIIDAIRNYSI
jgi:hypothetical protein